MSEHSPARKRQAWIHHTVTHSVAEILPAAWSRAELVVTRLDAPVTTDAGVEVFVFDLRGPFGHPMRLGVSAEVAELFYELEEAFLQGLGRAWRRLRYTFQRGDTEGEWHMLAKVEM